MVLEVIFLSHDGLAEQMAMHWDMITTAPDTTEYWRTEDGSGQVCRGWWNDGSNDDREKVRRVMVARRQSIMGNNNSLNRPFSISLCRKLQRLACQFSVFHGSTRLHHATPSHNRVIGLWTSRTMSPITHKPQGVWLAALRLHAFTLASTEAVISLSGSGVRKEEKETRTRRWLKVRAKGMWGETPVKEERTRDNGRDLNLMSTGRNCTGKSGAGMRLLESRGQGGRWMSFQKICLG